MRSVAAVVLAASALLGGAAAAQAQTFTVTDTSDSGAVGDGSLRGELKSANLAAGPDTVVFVPGLTGTIVLTGGDLTIKGGVDIDGPGPGELTVEESAGSGERVFTVAEASKGEAVRIAGLHIADGTAPSGGAHSDQGGDLYNAGAALSLEDDLITGGSAEIAGGVASWEGPTTIRSTTVSENAATYLAGVATGGKGEPWTIADSTIADNDALSFDGGLSAEDTGLLEGSTISGNTAGEGDAGASLGFKTDGQAIVVRNTTIADNVGGSLGGGGLTVWGEEANSLAIEDSTIADNISAESGAGILDESSTVQLSLLDTIVAGNTGKGVPSDIEGPFANIATAFALVGESGHAHLTESVPGSDLRGVDPGLGPLADNAGPTETMALTPGSPAVDKGGGTLTTDQRGDPRPVLYPGVPLSGAPGADGADIGAYELQAPPPVTQPPPSTPSPTPPPSPRASTAPRVRVSCPRSAGRGGCRIALQVVSARPPKVKGKGRRVKPPVAESTVARVKLAAGKSVPVTLTPKPGFAARLDSARQLLVREVETVKGKTDSSYRRLEVIG